MSTKISQLTSATDVTASDLMQIVDVEDGVMAPSGTNKKATAQLVANNLAKIINDGAVITANTSTDAVRITQTGSGNALVVEDSTNPDATPFFVTSSGSVKIGTTAPSDIKIHVVGEPLTPSSSLTYAVAASNTGGGNADVTIGSDSSYGYVQSWGKPLYLNSQGNNIVFGSGNVGIGTATPTAKLNVVDNSSSDALRITQTGSGNALVVEDSTNPDATPFVVNDEGRLLIGNSTSLVGPSAFARGLQLTNQGAQFNAFTSNQFGEGIAFVKTRGTPSSPHTIVQLNDALGSVSFSGSDGSGYVVGSQIASFVDQVPGANDMPTCLTFATTPDGSATCTERMRITSAGNVGIGTASPTSRLDVRGGNGTIANFVGSGGQFQGIGMQASDASASTAKATFIDSKNENSVVVANVKVDMFTDGGSSISFETTPAGSRTTDRRTENMRITSAGNVGIGTATPSSKLHVAGDLTMSSATVATSATAGTNGDVPAQVAGYLVVNINGTARKIPYYA